MKEWWAAQEKAGKEGDVGEVSSPGRRSTVHLPWLKHDQKHWL